MLELRGLIAIFSRQVRSPDAGPYDSNDYICGWELVVESRFGDMRLRWLPESRAEELENGAPESRSVRLSRLVCYASFRQEALLERLAIPDGLDRLLPAWILACGFQVDA